MLRKVVFSFCLFYSLSESYVTGLCDHLNSSIIERPAFEVRGIFQPCGRQLSGKYKNVSNEEGEQGNSVSMKCTKRIFVNMKIINEGPIRCHDHLILLDHVYDPLVGGSSRLLNPVVIRVKQEQIIKLYNLEYLQGACCSCNMNLRHRHSKCNVNNRECLRRKYGPPPQNKCIIKNHDSCLNKESRHNHPESPKSSHVSHIADIDMKNILCHEKPTCNTKSHRVDGDDAGVDDESHSLVRNLVSGNDDIFLAITDFDSPKIYSYVKPLDERRNGTNTIDDVFSDHKETIVNENKNVSLKRGINAINDDMGMKDDEKIWNTEDKDIQNSKSLEGAMLEEGVENVGYESEVDQDESISGELEEKLKGGTSHATILSSMDNTQGVSNEFGEDYEDNSAILKSRKHLRGFNSRLRKLRHKGCVRGPSGSKSIIHCLRFSELWYEVYRLSNFTYKHVIHLKVFEKDTTPDGSQVWVEHTQGKAVRLSSLGGGDNDMYKYKILQIQEEQTLLNSETHCLLVPRALEGPGATRFPEASGDPAEFLVLGKDLITANGSECDKVGVGIEAFLTRRDRCTARPGVCLQNQPSTLWRMDKIRKRHGEKGQFFLENFGQLTKNAYKVDEISGSKTLGLDFNGTHVSQTDIMIDVTSNYVVRRGMPAQITAVVADARVPNHTVLTVSVSNVGLASALFTVQLGKCIPELIRKGNSTHLSSNDGIENSSSNGTTNCSFIPQTVVISPLHQADFIIRQNSEITEQKVSCTVEVHNEKNKILAVRRVTIKSGARCICLWHCQCICIKSMLQLKCRLMTISEVHAAGLQGTIPVLLPLKPYGYFIIFESDDIYRSVLFFLIGMLTILLLLGLTKALLGLTFWPSIWVWGLPYYCHPKQISHYREPELVHRKVNYDDDGYPVHPDTKKRTVQLYSRWIELILNILIFLVFPILAVFWWPICWCCSLIHTNVIGYRWTFSVTNKTCGSNDGTSETSSRASLLTSDLEDGGKSSTEGKSLSKSMSKTGSERSSSKSSSSSKGKVKDHKAEEDKNDGGEQKRDDQDVEENNYKCAQLNSAASSQNVEAGSHIASGESPINPLTSVGNLSPYESVLSIETYDGTADEQEASDVEYVLKQLQRSSTAIQKSRERISTIGSQRPSQVMAITSRGEIPQDPDASPRMESSSEGSVQGDVDVVIGGAEEKERDLSLSHSAMDGLVPTIPQPDNELLEIRSASSSHGQSGPLPVSLPTMEYALQNSQSSPMAEEPSEKSDSTREAKTEGSNSDVTTKDSLEVEQDMEGNEPEEVAEALVEKLHAKRVVFRNIAHPIAGVVLSNNQPYTIRGYFLKTNCGYKFIPPTPLVQYWTLGDDGARMEPLEPQKELSSSEFERDYDSSRDVAEAGDLSLFPLSTCINVRFQNFDSSLSLSNLEKE